MIFDNAKPSEFKTKLSSPPDINRSIEYIFYDVLNTTLYKDYISQSRSLFTLAENSISKPELIEDIKTNLKTLPIHQTDDFIHLLHLTLFIKTLSTDNLYNITAPHIATPVTDAVTTLLSHTTIPTALKLIPMHLIDVLTSHPVDMDRGLVVNYKRHLESLTRLWNTKKQLYPLIQDENTKMAARAELGNLSQSIRDALCYLIHTPNYRKTKIKPESEQRNLSRAIKANETPIITHWPKLILFVQFVFFEAMISELIHKKEALTSSLNSLYGLLRTPDNLNKLKECPPLQQHPSFLDVINLQETLRYSLQIWRGDMDGNPFVTGDTIALSTSYGRKRCFERLSADDAVIRYSPRNTAFLKNEIDIKTRLTSLKETGEPAWKTYIQHREDEEWNPTQIYSGLMYYRMVEMTEAAEKYNRHRNDITLLQVGFKNEADFLNSTAPLQKAEEAASINNGTWSKYRRLVALRGLSLGLPHTRKGESFHYDVIVDVLISLHTEQNLTKKTIELKTIAEKKELLRTFLVQNKNIHLNTLDNLSESTHTLLDHYHKMMDIQPDATLVQSDSGSVTHDIELSILILKSISLLIGHTGSIVILCEDKQSMLSAITLMNNAEAYPHLFERVIMMCAGSDNQKKAGPFYSTYINTLFLKTAQKKEIPSFFGVGDSPLRSSTLDPQCSLKTFQPGSRKHFFFGDSIYPYLSNRLATQINHISFNLSLSEETETIYNTITTCLGDSMYDAYYNSVRTREQLHHAIQSISEIVTTYFSRPSKKYSEAGFILDKIRAIDSGRAQLILNTFDPQLSGLNEGLIAFKTQLKRCHISESTCHSFFNITPIGKSILNTLSYFANHLDDALPDKNNLRKITIKDIKKCYHKLSGRSLIVKTDPYLRVSRLVWDHVQNTPEANEHQAVAMMMFGANWMI